MIYSRLQYISQGSTSKEQLHNIVSALEAGCEWIQLRYKSADNKELCDLAAYVRKLCSAYHAIFIVNDHVGIAKMFDADGVHLGLLDTSIIEARSVLGENKIIGGTANTISDVKMRIEEKCNYIGLGPFRYTSTKEKLGPILGLNGLAQITKSVLTYEKQIPIYAIGGIDLEDVSAIMNTGVYGIAVSGGITRHANKTELIQKLNLLLYETHMY
jgi:thiamine-phosphate pyrophosphorylase